MYPEKNLKLLATENADEMAKWASERAEFSPNQRAQSRAVETIIFVHV